MASKRKSASQIAEHLLDDELEPAPPSTPSWVDLLEFEELKLLKDGHRMRGMKFGNIRSGPGLTIMLSQLDGTPFVTYRIVESGVLVGTANVATAIPKVSSMAQKFQKTSKLGLSKKISAAKRPAPEPVDEEVSDG